MKSYSKYQAILERIKQNHADRLLRTFQLHCEAGNCLDSAVLKLQKSNWSDHGMGQGIFFSIWLGNREIQTDRFNYNIHAIKLGLQKSCGVKPVAFARAFRSRFAFTGWPNINTDYGPQTLMQGWLPLHPRTFEQDVLGLIERFASTHHTIDELLNPWKGRLAIQVSISIRFSSPASTAFFEREWWPRVSNRRSG